MVVIVECMRLLTIYSGSHCGVYEVVSYSSSHCGVYEVVNYSIVIVKCHGMRLLVIMECMRLLTVYLVVIIWSV